MTAASLAAPPQRVILGVDTHTDTHVGVALDDQGRRLGIRQVPPPRLATTSCLAGSGRWGHLARWR
jgi:hypothetical protein